MAAMREEKTSVAFECFQKACDVSPEMASHVIKVLISFSLIILI